MEKTKEMQVIEDTLNFIQKVLTDNSECYDSDAGRWYKNGLRDIKDMILIFSRIREVEINMESNNENDK